MGPNLTCLLINITFMAERLVILSDLWGAKKGLWITSYLGYLQQYFDIVWQFTEGPPKWSILDILIFLFSNLPGTLRNPSKSAF